MRLAFLISAHNDAKQFHRLLNALPADAHFYVHIDAKSDIRPFEEGVTNRNVVFLKKRYDIMWGSFQQVRYQMELLRAALNSGHDYNYLFSLSGLDYPLWKNSEIKEFLAKNFGKQHLFTISLADNPEIAELYTEYRFLNIYSWRYGSWKSKFRVALRHLVKAVGIRKSLTINGRKLYKGGSWWAITGNLARYVLNVYDKDKSFVNYFINAFGPDETFIHTIAMNSPFASSCTLLDGKKYNSLEALSPLTYIEYGKEIKVFTEKDYERLYASGKMFCRKVMTGKSNALLELIDSRRKEE